MERAEKFVLDVTRPKELMQHLIDAFPMNSLLSLEGDLTHVRSPKYLFSTNPTDALTRCTIFPKQDFWVFKLDVQSRDYLKNDLFERIGIKSNVLHVLVSFNSNLLFASYDNFLSECVWLSKSLIINDEYVQDLLERKIIGYWHSDNVAGETE